MKKFILLFFMLAACGYGYVSYKVNVLSEELGPYVDKPYPDIEGYLGKPNSIIGEMGVAYWDDFRNTGWTLAVHVTRGFDPNEPVSNVSSITIAVEVSRLSYFDCELTKPQSAITDYLTTPLRCSWKDKA